MKEFFCRLFTPWRAGAQFDAPEAFYGFLLARNKLLGIIRNLCFGAALVLAALGLLLLFFAVWFFIRCVVGFVNLILRKGREWCYDHGEVDT